MNKKTTESFYKEIYNKSELIKLRYNYRLDPKDDNFIYLIKNPIAYPGDRVFVLNEKLLSPEIKELALEVVKYSPLIVAPFMQIGGSTTNSYGQLRYNKKLNDNLKIIFELILKDKKEDIEDTEE